MAIPTRSTATSKVQSLSTNTKRSRFRLISSHAVSENDWNHEWLIRDVLVANQLGVIGGPMKCLKTSMMLDMAISLASRTKFLGHFPVSDAIPVAVFSGKSGQATIKETANRICKSKGIQLCDSKVS